MSPTGLFATFDEIKERIKDYVALDTLPKQNTNNNNSSHNYNADLPPVDLPPVFPGDKFPDFDFLLKNLADNNWIVEDKGLFAISPSGDCLTFDQIKNAIHIAEIRLYSYDPNSGTFSNEYNRMSFEMLVERYYNQTENDIFQVNNFTNY